MSRSPISWFVSVTLLTATGCGSEAATPSAPPSTTVTPPATATPSAPPPAAAPSTPTPSAPSPSTPSPSTPTPGEPAPTEPTAGLGSTDAPQLACSTDEDCVLAPASSCCPPCCDCPTVMSRAGWEQMQVMCAVADCMGHDCSAVRCMACPPLTAARCLEGRCTGT